MLNDGLARFLFTKLQLTVAAISGYRIYVFPSAAHGHHDLSDIRRTGITIKTVFDVGANIGQSAMRFRAAFPDASIHCFEPVSTTYKQLISNQRSRRVVCHKLALADKPGRSRIYLSDLSVTNSMVEHLHGDRFEEIEVETVDLVRKRLGVDSIDLLKIDAEGFDLHVLRGAEDSLRAGSIGFVLIEVGFTGTSEKHISLPEFDGILTGFGFKKVGFYEQTPEWSGQTRLRFANVLYANHEIAACKRRK